jgi:RNase P/RNase MRP subunit POP5
METSKYLATFPIPVPVKHEIRNRYIVLRIDSEEQVPRNILINALVKASNSVSAGCYKEVAPWLTYFEANVGVVKYNHKHKETMMVIVERIKLTDRDNKAMNVTSLGISGTINKARKKYIR